MRYWTKELIIDELRRVRKDGPKPDMRIDSAARRHFGSLKAALDAAGLQFGKTGLAQKKWTKELIVHEIRSRANSYAKLKKTRSEDSRLYAVAIKKFGSWGKALEAAEVTSIIDDYFYTLDEVQMKIVELYEKNIPLRLNRQKDEKFKRSVIKRFGTWRQAVKSLGLGPMLLRDWTDQKVIEAIRNRWAEGHELSRTRAEDPGLASAAVLRFGGWVKALEAAGFEGQARRRLTNDEVLEAIRVHVANYPSLPISVHNKKLADLARSRFGTLHRAYLKANVPPFRDCWTRQRVIAEINRKYQIGRLYDSDGFGDPELAKVSRRFFGGWAEAVEAAGLSSKITVPKPPRKWDANDVIDVIRRCRSNGQSFSQMIHTNKGLKRAAKRNFDSWSEAIIAAGFELSACKWSREEIVSQIQERVRSGMTLRATDSENFNLVSASKRFFGSWKLALDAAGVIVHRDSRGIKS